MNRSFLPLSAHKSQRALLLLAVVLAGLGCSSRRTEFIGGRALDACNGDWPVCDTIVGCVLGAQSYKEGHFPGDARFIITLLEPSGVYVSVYLDAVGAAGDEMAITWWEDRCRSRIRDAVEGKAFVEETERVGYYMRRAELSGLGDHLIEVANNGEADFLVKVDVIPLRLENTMGLKGDGDLEDLELGR